MDRVDSFTLPPKGLSAQGRHAVDVSKERTIQQSEQSPSTRFSPAIVRSASGRRPRHGRPPLLHSISTKALSLQTADRAGSRCHLIGGRAPGRGSTGMTLVHPPRRSRCVFLVGRWSSAARVAESDLREGQFASIWHMSRLSSEQVGFRAWSALAPGVPSRRAHRIRTGVAFRVRSPYVTDT